MSNTNNNKPKMNMPRFNLSWLYITIAISLAYLFFTGDESNGFNRQLPPTF